MSTDSAKPAEPAASDAEGFVLAGGMSSRMGRDKALVELGRRLMIEWSLDVLRRIGLPVRIAGARAGAAETLSELAPVVFDETPDAGPLGGLCSALRQARAELAVLMPVDLPLIPPSLPRYLIRHAQISGAPATVCSLNGFAQTFPAVVRRGALPSLSAELDAGRSGCFAAFRVAGVSVVPLEMLVQSGHVADERGWSAFRWFCAVNTPAELEQLRRFLMDRVS